MINASPVDMEIGQIMPDDPSYNFRGVLDEIKIYDYAQSPDSVAAESGLVITATEGDQKSDPFHVNLFPNPALRSMTIEIPSATVVNPGHISLTISDLNGHVAINSSFDNRPIKTIDISSLSPGLYFARIVYHGNVVIKKFIIE